MGQPFDYTVQSPQNAFQSAYAFGANIAARRQAIAQQQQEQQRAMAARRDMQMVYDDPTPENISRFYMAYPDYREHFEAARKPLTDAAKADDIDFSSRALMQLSGGNTDAALAMMQDRITALKNTPGREQEAAATEALAKTIKADPKIGKQLFSMKLAAANPELYKTIFGQADMTGFQKDLAAAGIDPTSEEGRAKAAEYVALKTDPIVQMPTADGGQFIGRQSEYYRMFGQGAPAPSNKVAAPITKADYDRLPAGAQYRHPDGSIKIKGGGANNGTGNFR